MLEDLRSVCIKFHCQIVNTYKEKTVDPALGPAGLQCEGFAENVHHLDVYRMFLVSML